MTSKRRSPSHVLAPISLIAFGLALLLIVTSAGGGDGDTSKSEATKQEQRDLEVSKEKQRRIAREKREQGKLPQGVYVVKTGDTLGSIAQKTGVPVEKLQEMNPELDPQALVSGQKIKLRE
jgi:LysM repeat protein